MVGVPGRSRACIQCKQRRIACDLKQPQCARCIKSKRTCEYAKGHIFVLADQGSHKTKYRKECAISNPASYSKEQSNQRECFQHYGCAETLIKVPSYTKILQQALLASGISYGQYSKPSSYYNIISSSLNQSADSALYTPALACYSLWRGRQDGNFTMIDISRQLYLNGLAATKNALTDPRTTLSDVTLAACHALGLYEALECPGKSATGYMWHRAACCKLIQLRGPEAHREGLGHDLFSSLRIFAVLEAVELGEQIYLGDQEWMTTPWDSRPKTTFDKIIDICMLSPAIVTKANGLKCVPGDQLLSLTVSIVADIAALIHKFDTFYFGFIESSGGAPLFWEIPEPEIGHIENDNDSSSSVLTFDPTLCFSDLDTASILFMYWSSQLSLWAGLKDLSNLASQLDAMDTFYSTIQSHLGEDLDLSLELIQAKLVEMARKVCGSVAYCTSPSALESGPPRMSTALNMLIETLKNRKGFESEFAWALRARKEVGRRWIHLMAVLP